MQHIAFDIGSVICHIDLEPFFKEMQAYCGYSKAVTNLYLDCNANFDFCNTRPFKLSLVKLVYKIMRYEPGSWESNEIVNRLLDSWNKCLTLNDTMFNFISNLHEDGFKIALLSNIGSAHAEKLESDYPELFNKIYYKHYSFECGMAKPSKLFFQSFLLQNEDFAGCVYLDDKIENIKMGSSCKFSGILFDLDKFNSKLDLKKELDRIRKRLG